MSQLDNYVTNLDQQIFGLTNLPEVVKGALFSRYSRSDKDLRRLLLEEFLPEDNRKDAPAEAFYDRVFGGYGDDSVAELGGAHIACEGISNIAAKFIEESRVGISFLEKSTRYVVFGCRADGTYPYYREPLICGSSYKALYERTLDNLFEQYNGLLVELIPTLEKWYPQDKTTSLRAYNATIKAKSLDLLRGLLPLATLTNVGMVGNGLAYEHLLIKLYASNLVEHHLIAELMQKELEKTISSFVKRARSDYGIKSSSYLHDKKHKTKEIVAWLVKKYEPTRSTEMKMMIQSSDVQMVNYDPLAEQKIVAAIIFPESNLDMEECIQVAWKMSRVEMTGLLKAYAGDRKNRRHRPGRAFEEIFYTFEICADIGVYRDLQRHRMLSQERQDFTIIHGFSVPDELEDAGMSLRYKVALGNAATCYQKLVDHDYALEAQYVIPFAYRVRWKMKVNLRELFHLIELRSQIQGHSSYRAIAHEMYYQLKKIHPCFTELMTWVDLNNCDLARLASEKKNDVRS